MRVLALQRESHVASGVASLSVAARVTEVLDYLEMRGDLVFTTLPENDPVTYKGVDWADALVLSKHSSEQAVNLARRARARGIKVIYDIDDWIFSFPKYSGGHASNNKLSLIYELIGLSNVVTVANVTLLNRVQSFVPSPVLVPNGMWVEKYVDSDIKISNLEAKPPRIVFTNADFLKMHCAKDMLLTALQVFFIRHPEYVLDFYGDPFPEMFSMPFLHFTNRMPYSDYMQALASGRYQFSITPLGGNEDAEESEFNSCKNPFKYLNYGAARVPGIYSRAQIYEKCVIHEKTGIIAENNLQSWVDSLEMLASDSDLRQRIRSAAFMDVMKFHHIRNSADALMEVLADS